MLRARGESPEARAALGELCESYWNPVFRFLRREGHPEDQARELTQEFFARLLQRHGFGHVDQLRGRFRSFLLGAVKHFLADVRDHGNRLKRGSGLPPVPLDTVSPSDSSPGIPPPPSTPGPPDTYFDQQWAVNVMNRALAVVEAEYLKADRVAHFEALRPWLGGDEGPAGQLGVARRLGLSEGALRVAIHRLRRRFREQIRAEVAQTVPEFAEVDDELRYLVEVLSAR